MRRCWTIFLRVSLVSLLQLSPPSRDATSSEVDFLTIPDSAGKLVVCQCAFHPVLIVRPLAVHSLGSRSRRFFSPLPRRGRPIPHGPKSGPPKNAKFNEEEILIDEITIKQQSR